LIFFSHQIRNVAAIYCIDGSTGHRDLNKAVIGFPCHQQGGNQVELSRFLHFVVVFIEIIIPSTLC